MSHFYWKPKSFRRFGSLQYCRKAFLQVVIIHPNRSLMLLELTLGLNNSKKKVDRSFSIFRVPDTGRLVTSGIFVNDISHFLEVGAEITLSKSWGSNWSLPPLCLPSFLAVPPVDIFYPLDVLDLTFAVFHLSKACFFAIRMNVSRISRSIGMRPVIATQYIHRLFRPPQASPFDVP